VENAASSRMFKSLWLHGRAICFADGGFKWKKEGDKKQLYFINRKDGQPRLEVLVVLYIILFLKIGRGISLLLPTIHS
jgi:hypothetical protein